MKIKMNSDKCAVGCCTKASRYLLKGTHTHISEHRFPKFMERKLKWIKFVRSSRQDMHWLPERHARICSLHFEEKCFDKKNPKLHLLKPDAVPTIMDTTPQTVTSVTHQTVKIERIFSDSVVNDKKMEDKLHPSHENEEVQPNVHTNDIKTEAIEETLTDPLDTGESQEIDSIQTDTTNNQLFLVYNGGLMQPVTLAPIVGAVGGSPVSKKSETCQPTTTHVLPEVAETVTIECTPSEHTPLSKKEIEKSKSASIQFHNYAKIAEQTVHNLKLEKEVARLKKVNAKRKTKIDTLTKTLTYLRSKHDEMRRTFFDFLREEDLKLEYAKSLQNQNLVAYKPNISR